MRAVSFKCDLTKSSSPFPHFWEHTVGSCHATLALRADWQKQMERCHKELGFKHVRFHGMLSDDMSTLVCENEELIYSFFNADQICDFLLSIGMRPFIELSFMPTTLSSGNDTVFHYKANVDPPSNYDAWATLILKIVEHWVQRYGKNEVSKWFFEVWNEPNLKSFWKGNQKDYFKLYEHTVKAIKSIDNNLKVGGPATAKNAWITSFLEFCEKKSLPVDFISTHHYPTDAFSKMTDNTILQLAKSKPNILMQDAKKVKNEAKGRPVYYTEWSTSSNAFDELHDHSYAAAHIIKNVMQVQGLVEGYSYWTFSDIFEENYFSSIPFHGGFGLMNIYGIPKPSYRAYELLHHIGTESLPVQGSHKTVEVWVIQKSGKISVMITNCALPQHPIKTETVKITLKGIKNLKKSYIQRIDDHHANATHAWINLGKPGSLSKKMVEELDLKSKLIKEPIQLKFEGSTAIIEIVIEPNAVTCITLENK